MSMIYTKIGSKDNIEKFEVKDGNIIFLRENNVFLNDKLVLKANIFNVGYFMNDSVIYGNLDVLMRLHLENNETEKLNPKWSYHWDSLEENKILISNNRRKNKLGSRVADYYYHDLRTKQISKKLFTESPQVGIIKKRGLISDDFISLRFLSLTTHEYQWELDLSGPYYNICSGKQEKAKIISSIGAYQDTLLIGLDNHKLLGISISTGQILWEKASPLPESSFYLSAHLHYLDADKGILYFLNKYGFAELDLKTLHFSRIKQDIKGYEDSSSGFSNFLVEGDYFYFTACKQTYPFSYWIGIFHVSTMEVVWEYESETGRGFPWSPQVDGNKLYFLDDGGTLHVFERKD